ncbi:uncharacterized protein FIBRA_03472 [Fibroporia radiculosa]|uniref:Cytochrome P450 n=1 Tax=Fibroporia radiculosa TaxID=599839 RepID=J4I9M5_9APHY|nr:uncharacterized protein FIBRA_03472 [Fibroporia radiculosa]CCM01421.1 predicted protein [Fibroporia radiculosa]
MSIQVVVVTIRSTILIMLAATNLLQPQLTGRQRRFPPGPKLLPLIGNVHHVALHYQQKTFARWMREYGDVIFSRLLNTPVVVLGSAGQTKREVLL